MDWKVTKEQIEVFPHFNSDNLSIGKVGDYQVVFNTEQAGHKTGDTVIFIPEKSVLPDNLKIHWEQFLKGSDKNRVGSIRLRGEISQGIVLKEAEARKIMGDIIDSFDYGVDVSERLNITKYEPPIPSSLMGTTKSMEGAKLFKHHDCVQFSINIKKIKYPVKVLVSEKLHGSLVAIYVSKDKKITLTSKGLAKRGIEILEDESNTYWKALRNTLNLEEIKIDSDYQIFGEVIPVQKGYSYGQTEPVLKVFRFLVDGKEVIYENMPEAIQKNFVPIVWFGYVDSEHNPIEKLREYCEGTELVSGKGLHIREGVVVSSLEPDEQFFQLKIINPKYKESGEEIN